MSWRQEVNSILNSKAIAVSYQSKNANTRSLKWKKSRIQRPGDWQSETNKKSVFASEPLSRVYTRQTTKRHTRRLNKIDYVMKSLWIRNRTKILRHNILLGFVVVDVVAIRAALIGCKFHANARRRSKQERMWSQKLVAEKVEPVRFDSTTSMDHSDIRMRSLVSQKSFLVHFDQFWNLIKYNPLEELLIYVHLPK